MLIPGVNSTYDKKQSMKGEEEQLPYLFNILGLSASIYAQLDAGMLPAATYSLEILRVQISQQKAPLMQLHLNQLARKQAAIGCLVSNTTVACA
jgi:hypothetical protein